MSARRRRGQEKPLRVTSVLSSPASCTVTPAALIPVIAPGTPEKEMDA